MRRRAITTLWIAGACATVGLLSGVHQYYTNIAEGEPNIVWSDTLVRQLVYWFAWGAIMPLILWLTSRPRVAVLVLAAVPICVARVGASYAIQWLFVSGLALEPHGFVLYTRAWLRIDLITYAAVVSAMAAVGHWRKGREAEVQLSEARLRALQMQIHPHFLFNTLNTIAMLIRTANPARALAVLAELGDLLRQMLDDDPGLEVPLREELRFLEGYLGIERARFSDRLRVTMTVEPQALDAHVPRFVLQPLVENAIRHGIAKRVASGVLTITGARAGSSLSLVVSDDGPGPAVDSSDGVGLANTRERLRHLYGDEGVLSLTQAPGGGAVASITLPWHTS
ncbi:MAG TPA: histidine kinase [Gemmatimonadaceae bacterium]|jgi:two-component system LytT family sensor kinase|nr:histidine kinase [Gemmatimonadaceae bacterium]